MYASDQVPAQSPLYHARQAGRYDRQQMIGEYQKRYSCRLVVAIDAIFSPSVTLFEELIYDAEPSSDLHLLLASPGGDGETAVRLVRAAQARCRELTVIVPDQAKSAGTLLTLGAHHILMGPASDLGPIDPQFMLSDGSLASAKDIIAAVDDATEKVQQAPDTYPIYASLLGDVTALQVQQARSALERTEDQLEEALRSNPDRTDAQVEQLAHHHRVDAVADVFSSLHQGGQAVLNPLLRLRARRVGPPGRVPALGVERRLEQDFRPQRIHVSYQ